jgi:hypothetical protein
MCCKKHSCFITISVPARASVVTFPSNKRIEDGKVTSISIRRVPSGTATDKNGNTLAVDAVIAGAHFSFVTKDGKEVADFPARLIERDFNAPEPLQVEWTDLDLTQSRIIIPLTATGYNAAHVIEATFGLECDTCGNLIPSKK